MSFIFCSSKFHTSFIPKKKRNGIFSLWLSFFRRKQDGPSERKKNIFAFYLVVVDDKQVKPLLTSIYGNFSPLPKIMFNAKSQWQQWHLPEAVVIYVFSFL